MASCRPFPTKTSLIKVSTHYSANLVSVLITITATMFYVNKLFIIFLERIKLDNLEEYDSNLAKTGEILPVYDLLIT